MPMHDGKFFRMNDLRLFGDSRCRRASSSERTGRSSAHDLAGSVRLSRSMMSDGCAPSRMFLVQTMLLFQNHTEHSIGDAASG